MRSDEVRHLETLIEINALINSQYRDLRVLLSRIMESAERLISSEASSLLLVDSGSGQLHFEIALGRKGEDVKKYTLKMGEGIAGWVARNNRSLVVNDAENDPRHSSFIGHATGYRTRNLIAVPMRAKDEVVGVLEVLNKTNDGSYTDDDLRLLEVLADQASIAIQNAQEYGRLTNELDTLKRHVETDMAQREHRRFIWKSDIMGKVLDKADKMAPSDSPILIMGESGTGKELIAERIHFSSQRAEGPLIRVNCAALPESLAESELFGHVKGAFTDAVRDKKGFFERAENGTLFLDEVAELPLPAQAKLLRVLQDGYFQRVGFELDISANVRVVAATNVNLNAAVQKKQFRSDLYYRLAVLPLEVPPLRERPDDIEELTRDFLKELSEAHPGAPRDIGLEALEVLLSYRWPGNVRELKNAVERAVITGKNKSEIGTSDLGLPGLERVSSEYRGKNLKDSITLFKRNFIREVLAAHKGNQTSAAEALGIQRTYLSRMIRELNIDRRGDDTQNGHE